MDAQIFKRCNMCAQSKPLNEFHRERAKSHGRKNFCKECIKLKQETNPNRLYPPRKPRETTLMRSIGDFKCCMKCEEWKSLEGFTTDKRSMDGRQSVCKACYAAGKKLAYNSDPDYKLALQAYTAKQRARAENKAKKKEYDTSLSRLEIVRENRRKNRCRPKGRATALYHAARKRARERGLTFSLSKTQIEIALILGVCQRTGLRFDFNPPVDDRHINSFTPTIDRIDNARGYEFDNVQVVCAMYNSGKGEAKELDFIAMCIAVAERNSDNQIAKIRLLELRHAAV